MRILLVSSYYWPETAGNAPYVTGVAEHLTAHLHDVTVVTGFAHYPEWHPSSHGRLWARESCSGVDIRRRWHYVPRSQSAVTRALYEASLCTLGITALPRHRPDVILAVCPTLAAAVLARGASQIYRRPYGIVFQDLQGLGARQSGVEGGKRIAALVERAELHLARRAAAVGVITEGFRHYFEQRGVRAERIHRLRNWSQTIAPTEAEAETRMRLGWGESELVCLHAGNMGHKQGLENVLRAALAISDPRMRVVLAGDGNDRQRLEMLARHLGTRNVTFIPSQAPGLYESMLRAADVLLVNQRATVGEMSLASKLTSYFVAGRPVVAAVAAESETALELRRSGAGVLVPPDDPVALAEALTWATRNPGETRQLGANGESYAAKHLSADSVLAGYDALVRATASGTEGATVPGDSR